MIKESTLIELVKDYVEKPLPNLISRDLNVPLDLNIKRAISIIGPRRAGKTYYMFQLARGLNTQSRLYVNFEDYRLVAADFRDIIRVVEIFYRLFPESKNKKVYMFFDEIQNVANWEIAVRHLIDNEKCQIFLSGSSSKLLSKEIATQLRGRTLSYELFPFTFREFLRAKDFEINEPFSSSAKLKLLSLLEEYLKFGAYPEVALEKEKRKILEEIWDVTIARDVIERRRIRNLKVLKLLIKALRESKRFSVYKFYNFLKSIGLKVSKNTLYFYLEALKDSLVLFDVHAFSPSYKNIEKSIPKIYFADAGLYLDNFDIARSMENSVFLVLRMKYRNIYYYETSNRKEIDFLFKQGNKLNLIEVAYEIDQEHIKKLDKAMNELNLKGSTLITWNEEEKIKTKSGQIDAVPLWKFLLTNSIQLANENI